MLRIQSIFIFLIIFFLFTYLNAHSNEPPHLKYTREVNEAAGRDVGFDSQYHNHDSKFDDSHTDHEGHHHGHSHEHHDHNHHHDHSQSKSTLKKKLAQEFVFDKNGMFDFLNDAHARLWVYSIGSTVLISAFPCLILAFIPINANTNEDSPLLKILLAFGAGGLLGDAFLHLIPHATPASSSHSHSHSHQSHGHSHEPHDMSVGQWVLIGFMVFFIVEKFIRIIRGENSHSHSHTPFIKKLKESDSSETTSCDDESQSSQNKEKKNIFKKYFDAKFESDSPPIRVAAYLNLVADFMHNFTDGLAIGASFIAGTTVGLVTMMTVLVHEIPHEIGDFAILIQSGCTKKKAMFMQLCTAGGALFGCIISLWSVDAYGLVETAEQSWVLPFTAGGFIYIATVSVIPELLKRSTFWQSIFEVFAILFGLFLMYLIAIYE